MKKPPVVATFVETQVQFEERLKANIPDVECPVIDIPHIHIFYHVGMKLVAFYDIRSGRGDVYVQV